MKLFFKVAAILALAGLVLCQCTKPQPEPEPVDGFEDQLPKNQILRNVAVTTDKAVYAPGSTVVFTGDRSQSGLGVRYWHLGQVIREDLLEDSASWTWTPPSYDFQGYFVELIGKNAEGVLRTVGSVAVDVSSDWTRFPRYGFLSKFGGVVPSKRASVIANLNRYHINGISITTGCTTITTHWPAPWKTPIQNGPASSVTYAKKRWFKDT